MGCKTFTQSSSTNAMHLFLIVLLRYPKPTPKPSFFAKTVPRQNLVFSAIIDGFWAHLHANFTQQMFPSTLAHNFLSAIGIAPILWSTDV